MKRYKRILICIGNPDIDTTMLDYAETVIRLADSLEVHLLHVRPDQDIPPNEVAFDKEFLQDLAAKHLSDCKSDRIFCEVVSGAPLVEILRYMYDKDVDLVVIGGRNPEHESVLARRVTMKSTCSVLVLPEKTQVHATRILVPIRDSECSARALETACAIAEAANASVLALNVCRVHSDYSPAGTNLEDQTKQCLERADAECESLIEKVETRSVEVSCKSLPDLYGKQVSIILEAAATEAADLIVIGARGRTGAAGVLLGHITEDLIRMSPIPLLAVREKGECVGILRALLTLTGQDV